MASADQMAGVLERVAAREVDDAAGLVEEMDDLDELERRGLSEALRLGDPAESAAAMARVLRDDPRHRDAVNECNRAVFYLSGRSRTLADNPLYALFLAGRDGRLVDKWVHYFDVYHRALGKYRGTSPRVLEIGVYRGGGLALWRSYFGPGAAVVGIDIDPAATSHAAGSAVLIGDQADPSFLQRANREHGPFDIVIDDGGHTMNQQITAVETLFPLLATGGTYIVEDTHTSYWPEYRDRDETFIEWVATRIDSLHANFDPDGDPDSPWAMTLGSVAVSDSIVVLAKEDRFRPFSEVSGSTQFLGESRLRAARITELEQERAALRERLEQMEGSLGSTSEPGAPDARADEVRVLRAALKDARKQIGELSTDLLELGSELQSTQGRLIDAWSHVRSMRNTVSWRVTTPLRVNRLVRRR